ncbi:ABC transporter permease [Vallitalea pronyensis]|uniref:ABC transporter permease n=1 Tax=Vallitalea pronyensis TaxID=1348613 RepID=A0A8J8MGN5_9FIRM|nr:ABC transporter permease [Vallitalea pronyensis]QUI21157.1 ABC transporter permease [Vallitalea pronyensis]
MRSRAARLIHYSRNGELLKRYGMVLILLLMVVGFTVVKPVFFRSANIINIFRQVSVIGTIAFGVTLIIITGGIDLSSGSVVALVGVITASFAAPGQNVFIAVLIGLLIGAACGLFNGTVLAVTGIPPFIVTLGMMTAARGAALLFTGGRPVSNLSESFLTIGSGTVGIIPVPVIIFLSMGILTHILLRKTRFGKSIYAIGGNEQAAKVCGINVKKAIIIVYGFAGLMSAVAGIILTARVSSGNPTAGLSYELDAIASAVIGGTSLTGGVGYISGTIIGALIIGVLNNGLTLVGVSPDWQQIIKAIIIVGAVVLDSYRQKGGK